MCFGVHCVPGMFNNVVEHGLAFEILFLLFIADGILLTIFFFLFLATSIFSHIMYLAYEQGLLMLSWHHVLAQQQYFGYTIKLNYARMKLFGDMIYIIHGTDQEIKGKDRPAKQPRTL